MERTKSSHHDRMAQPLYLTYSLEWIWISTLIYDMEGTESSHHDIMAQPLYLTCLSEWIWDSSLSLGGNLDLENTKLLPEVLKPHPSNGFVNTSTICSSIATYWSFTAPLCTISLI